MEKEFKNLDELKEYFGDIEIREKDKKEVGTSFEPRTQTNYEVKSDNKIIGHYENIEVYQRNGKTLVTEFGKFVEN